MPTAHEVKLTFDLFKDHTPELVSMGMIAVDFLRCCETVPMRWPWLSIQDDKVMQLRHFIYKPSNRKTKQSNNWWYKETIKPVWEWSPWLSEQIVGYAKTAPEYQHNKIFPWNTSDGLEKNFINLRKKFIQGKLDPEYSFLLDKTGVAYAGHPKIQYRVNPYSFRRFSFTFHYWATFKQDVIKLCKIGGHASPVTTLQHYIMPKEAIGLTQEMIEDNITIDQFIHLYGKKQMRIVEFMPDWNKKFIPAGQRTLGDF